MKKLVVLLVAVMFVFAPSAYAGSNFGPIYSTGNGLDLDDPALEILGVPSVGGVLGPAPNSGDGVSDGSGFDSPPAGAPSTGEGPAPNAGDGIPDGSGF